MAIIMKVKSKFWRFIFGAFGLLVIIALSVIALHIIGKLTDNLGIFSIVSSRDDYNFIEFVGLGFFRISALVGIIIVGFLLFEGAKGLGNWLFNNNSKKDTKKK